MPTQAEIGAHLDLSQKAVSELMQQLGIDWKTTALDEIRTAYIRRLRDMAAGHKSSSGDDLIRERVENERLDRQLKELNLAEKRGQLVNVAQLEPMLADMVAAFRTELMTRDDRLKASLDALYGIDVDLQVLNDATHDCLQQLARYDPGGAGPGAPSGGEGGPAGEDDDDGLGAGSPSAERESHGAAGPVQPGPDAVGAADPPGAGRSGGEGTGVLQVGPGGVD
jgi:hypothetical protein